MRKLLLRLFWTMLIVASLLVGVVFAWLYAYKPVAVGKVEEALKQYCKAEIHYKWAGFGFTHKWGELTLSFYQVHMDLPAHATAQIGKIHFSLDWSSLWEGKYQIRKIYVEEADMPIDFWQIWKIPSDKRQLTCLQLESIHLKKIQLRTRALPTQTQGMGLIEWGNIDLTFKEVNDLQHFTIQATIDKCQYITQKKIAWEIQKGSLTADLAYAPQTKTWQFNETNLKIRDANFAIRGNCTILSSEAARIDLKFRGKEENLQNLLAFLPTPYYEEFAGYKTKGKINLQGSLQGEVGKGKNPALEIDFGGQDLTILSPHTLQQSISALTFAGKVDSKVWRMTEMAGKLGTQKFKGAFTYQYTPKPHIVADLEAGFDLNALYEFYPIPKWEYMKGLAGCKIHLDTDVAEAPKIIATGELELIDVTAKFRDSPLSYQNINAQVFLQNEGATLQKFQTKWGANDLQAKGKIQNWLGYVFFEAQPLLFAGEASAKYLNLDAFTLPAQLQAEVRLSIDSLTFRKIHAKNTKADISLKDKTLKSGNLMTEIGGGTLSFLGILNAQKENFITLDGRVILKNTEAGKVLNSFGNFGQITGKLDADIRSSLVLDKNLQIKLSHAVYDAEIHLKNGEIYEAQILDDLAQKVQLPEVKHIAFQEIHALLQLRNQTLFVPEFELNKANSQELFLGVIGKSSPEKGLDFKIRLQPKRNLVYHVNWTGTAHSFGLAFPAETEQPHLETNWQREKLTYLKIFKRQNTHENIKIDTVGTGK